MTIYDISETSLVFPLPPVSRVLNGSHRVRPKPTRKKVTGYDRKNTTILRMHLRAALGLHSVHDDSGSLPAPDLLGPFSRQGSVLSRAGASVRRATNTLLCCTGYNLDIKKNYLNLIFSKKRHGIILVGSNFIGTNEEENQYILKDVSAQVPIMLLNASFDYPGTCTAHSAAITHLCSRQPFPCLTRGLRTFSYLYNSNSYSGVKKLGGFRAAMEAHSVPDYEKRDSLLRRETRGRWTTSPVIWNVCLQTEA